MAFENVDLFDAVANASLEKYGWQDRCEAKLIVLSENATYMIKNKETSEKEGVLRISRPGYHTLDELNSEMKWLRQINDYTPLLVANPIKGLDGKNIQGLQDRMEMYISALYVIFFWEKHLMRITRSRW